MVCVWSRSLPNSNKQKGSLLPAKRTQTLVRDKRISEVTEAKGTKAMCFYDNKAVLAEWWRGASVSGEPMNLRKEREPASVGTKRDKWIGPDTHPSWGLEDTGHKGAGVNLSCERESTSVFHLKTEAHLCFLPPTPNSLWLNIDHELPVTGRLW